MGATTTVVFADLTGSTGVFETLGNSAATQTITALTQWIARVCTTYGGRVVKTLGDGVLALFPDGHSAVLAAVQLQREQHKRKLSRGPAHLMDLQVGMACGEIVEVDGDCYGDAVNVASRLCDLSGAEQIWATESVVDQVPDAPPGARFRWLGPVTVRGRSEPLGTYRIEWHEDVATDMMTLPPELGAALAKPAATTIAYIELSWLDQHQNFDYTDMPIHLGRVPEAEFVVADQRVSRLHARIDWHDGRFVLTDLSSYGTWVRFEGTPTELPLRRGECVLHDSGAIALGAPFSDFTVPTVRFNLVVAG